MTQSEWSEPKENCALCGKPFGSEYHMSDECVNLAEEK